LLLLLLLLLLLSYWCCGTANSETPEKNASAIAAHWSCFDTPSSTRSKLS
jgi:hypothetical protein